MILNGFPVDPDRLKIVILSTPKTGNTRLRWLLHYAYGIPIVELPPEWTPGCADDLPPRFVTHQHLFPSESLAQWLVESRAVVLTTIRHPAAAFLSYFHFVKWYDAGDPSTALLKRDGDRPGKNALTYINYWFPQIYAISLAWAKLGAHVVRYEDLLVDPLLQLREVTSKIVPLDEERLKAAVFFCKPEQLTGPGLVDARHLCTRSARRWIQELPSEIVDALANSQAYASACKRYEYDWSRSALEPSGYDYDKIDPFRGHRQPAGRIRRLTMLDTDGAQTNSFRCADGMQIELEFHLDQPVDRSLIQYSLCNVNGEIVFGSNSELLGNDSNHRPADQALHNPG